MSHEIKLLLYCARTVIDLETHANICALAQQPLDWAFLIQMARIHGVLPLVYRSLNQICPGTIPLPLLHQLQQQFRLNTQQNLLLMQELLRLLSLFEQQSIPVLPFKGVLLAITVYGNLSLRQITDLDLLVDESSLETAKDLLLSQGYELRINVPWEMHLIRREQAYIYNIDLHNTIVPKHLSSPLQSTDVWRQVRSTTIAGASIPNLSPEMILLMLCLNGTKDGWKGLNRICDIAELIRTQSLDWAIVMQQAQTWRMQRLVRVGLKLAADLLHAKFPNSIEHWLESDRIAVALATEVEQRLFAPRFEPMGEVARTLFHMRTREKWWDQLHSFWGLMEHSGWLAPTPEDRAFVPLPAELEILYYLIRPVRIIRKYSGMAPWYSRSASEPD